jgi:hypothetical protein
VELADTRDLKSLACNGCAGSNPALGTFCLLQSRKEKAMKDYLTAKLIEVPASDLIGKTITDAAVGDVCLIETNDGQTYAFEGTQVVLRLEDLFTVDPKYKTSVTSYRQQYQKLKEAGASEEAVENLLQQIADEDLMVIQALLEG